jgi:hypothetical protein
MCAGHKVLMEVDDNIKLIVVDLRGILSYQLWPHPIHSLNIVILLAIVSNYRLLYYFYLDLPGLYETIPVQAKH